MGEVMSSLDIAMYALLEKKKQRLWELWARLDNAMIEKFMRNQVELSERLVDDMNSGFVVIDKPLNLSWRLLNDIKI